MIQNKGYARKRQIDPEEVIPYFMKSNPMGRLASIEDIAHAAIFLMSENASYITGQSIILSGGDVMS